jgi:hypothetical protein
MAKYRVAFHATASASVEVEAESEEEAREEAYNELYVSLCHQCARQVDLGDFEVDDDVESPFEYGVVYKAIELVEED